MASYKHRKVASKLCVKCGQVKPLNDFMPHKDWATQSYHDAWCRACCLDFCVTPEALKEYCWYNNRRYSQAQYEAALKKAIYRLSNNEEYLRAANNPDKRAQLEMRHACRQFFSLSNLPNFYGYLDNISDEGGVATYDHHQLETEAMGGDEPLQYSREWNGLYTQRDIDYLNGYYRQLEEDFVLDNENIRDYARKVSKASLDADLTYNKMRHGQASVSAWKEAQAIFD
ncbi:MAG: hypothetical protein AAGU32_22960, partial [Bacillota bacterium]